MREFEERGRGAQCAHVRFPIMCGVNVAQGEWREKANVSREVSRNRNIKLIEKRRWPKK